MQNAFNGRPILASDAWNQSVKNAFVCVQFPPKAVLSPGASVSRSVFRLAFTQMTCTFPCRLSLMLQRSKLNSDVDISRSRAFLHHTSLSAGGTGHRRGWREVGDPATAPDHDGPLSEPEPRPRPPFSSPGPQKMAEKSSRAILLSFSAGSPVATQRLR